ncbi:hypothetical protein L873DRAFT_1100191 [Choiromyces venosus 120613-1]|uniref:Uncharacterized protein n=1 Tax=Choiromyces venosus 120613-1 TaxID=1336337 RepID=A0A3N4JHE6_9PEZI|nr:hypothetical protein L873DRAFT_1100191 [Choiromyces venosus 120613-1]
MYWYLLSIPGPVDSAQNSGQRGSFRAARFFCTVWYCAIFVLYCTVELLLNSCCRYNWYVVADGRMGFVWRAMPWRHVYSMARWYSGFLVKVGVDG